MRKTCLSKFEHDFLNYCIKLGLILNHRLITDTDLDRVIQDKEEPLNPLIITKEMKSYEGLKKTTLLDLHFPKESKLAQNKENVSANESESKGDSESSGNKCERSFDFDQPMSEDGETKYLIEFNVLAYEPRDVREFVQAYCKSCGHR